MAVALAVGVWVGSTGGGRAVAQQQGGGPGTRSWPPAPSDIVCVAPPAETRVGLGRGAPGYLVYQVPHDKVLVVTDVVSYSTSANTLYEDLDGRTSVKLPLTPFAGQRFEYHSAVGLAFAPGSKIALQTYTADVQLTGYLTAP
jgi:hypothetical protein